jgi:hypothetical protein
MATGPVHAQSSRLIECCAELGRKPSNQWGVCISPTHVLVGVPIERKRPRGHPSVTNAWRQRSGHTNPLCSGHANRVSGAPSQIERNAARKRTAVVNCHRNGPAVLRIGNRHLRPERKRTMRRGQAACIEALTARRAAPRRIVSRNDMLSRTGSVRLGVREEPAETAALGRRRRSDQWRRNQCSDAKSWSHRSLQRLK